MATTREDACFTGNIGGDSHGVATAPSQRVEPSSRTRRHRDLADGVRSTHVGSRRAGVRRPRPRWSGLSDHVPGESTAASLCHHDLTHRSGVRVCCLETTRIDLRQPQRSTDTHPHRAETRSDPVMQHAWCLETRRIDRRRRRSGQQSAESPDTRRHPSDLVRRIHRPMDGRHSSPTRASGEATAVARLRATQRANESLRVAIPNPSNRPAERPNSARIHRSRAFIPVAQRVRPSC